MECESRDQANTALANEDVWHCRYGHLGVQGLKQLAVDSLVNGFDHDSSKRVEFCEPCTKGNHYRSPTAEDVQRNHWILFILMCAESLMRSRWVVHNIFSPSLMTRRGLHGCIC